MGMNNLRGQEATQGRREDLGFGAGAKLLSLSGWAWGWHGAWEQRVEPGILGKARCSEPGVLAGRCVLGQDHATLPRQQFHPCASLSSRETWHYSWEIQIIRSTHSRSQLAGGPVCGSRRWAWSRAPRTRLGSSGPMFCKPVFPGTESKSREYL